MQPETPTGETPVATDPKTQANPTPAPQTPAVDPAVEELRKKAEQAEMRANQLQNQLKAKEEAEQAAKDKELEEQNQYKDLYEQEKAKREEVEAERAKAEKEAALKAESEKLFADYPAQVKEIAEVTGLTLVDTDDASIAAFKVKLDKLKPQVSGGTVTPNNPGTPTPVQEISNQDLAEIMKDPAKFQEYLQKNSKGMASMIRPKPE